jgi:hypothetical protein
VFSATMRLRVNISLGLYGTVSLLLPCLGCQRHPHTLLDFGEVRDMAIQEAGRKRRVGLVEEKGTVEMEERGRVEEGTYQT